jgi:maltodextrin utilization protein YvdJ
MIEEDYEFLFGLEGHKRIIKLNFTPNKLLLNKNEMNAFPLIFGNMQTEDELPTVKKIKELVSHEY